MHPSPSEGAESAKLDGILSRYWTAYIRACDSFSVKSWWMLYPPSLFFGGSAVA